MRGAGIKRGGAVFTAIKLDPLCKAVEIKFNISLPLVNTFLSLRSAIWVASCKTKPAEPGADQSISGEHFASNWRGAVCCQVECRTVRRASQVFGDAFQAQFG